MMATFVLIKMYVFINKITTNQNLVKNAMILLNICLWILAQRPTYPLFDFTNARTK